MAGRVLIADDDPLVREAVRDVLEATGLEVVGEAVDGALAVELSTALVPDVVVMDIRMPEMDGIEATARIRTDLPGVAVVVMTEHDDPEWARRSELAGAAAHIVKGSGAGALREAVGTALATQGRGSGRAGMLASS